MWKNRQLLSIFLKLDFDGNKIWEKRFPYYATNGGFSIREAVDGSYYFVVSMDNSTQFIRVNQLRETILSNNLDFLNSHSVVSTNDSCFVFIGMDDPQIIDLASYTYYCQNKFKW